MTEEQRLWEAWFEAFRRIHVAWPDQVSVDCPEGDGGRVRVAYIGNPKTRRGMAYAWCDQSRRGIYLSRVQIPPGAPMAAFDDPDEAQDAVVPADLTLLPPNPAPPKEEDA